mmetsp:Transcript_10439/g.30678  ORF Transcript_10439/g.30678 Transcript_10439/m.30678 type:complete len:253 (-) Transcript_10439:729-1487(-)
MADRPVVGASTESTPDSNSCARDMMSNPSPDVTTVSFCVSTPANDDLDMGAPPSDPLSDAMGGVSLGPPSSSGGGASSVAKPLDMKSGPLGFSGVGKGVVGTVTFLGKNSAMVWFGWGDLIEENGDTGGGEGCRKTVTNNVALGAGLPVMGPLSMATPRNKYSGAFSEKESPSTQLVAASSDEDMVASLQIASRLSSRVGWPVLVSCSLHSDVAGMEGMGAGRGGSLSQRAAALAEREACRILIRRRKELEV